MLYFPAMAMQEGGARKDLERLLRWATEQKPKILAATQKGKMLKPKKPRKRKAPAIVKWLRAAGIAAELFGWGGLVLAHWFWAGIVTIDLGFLFLALDIWYEPDLSEKWKIKLLVSAIVIGLAVAFTWSTVFEQAPLPVSAIVTDGEYSAGTVVSGIDWSPEFTELDVDIQNPTDDAYEDLDVVIRPTSAVAAIAQVTNVPDVSFEDKDGISTHAVDYDTRTGNSRAMPLILLATDAGYRVRCPHLPAHGDIKIVMALADIKWDPPPRQPGGPPSMSIWDPNYMMRFKTDDFSTFWLGYKGADVYANRPTSSEWLRADGDYMVGYRKRTISQKIQIMGNTSPMMPQAQPAAP